MNVVRIRCLLLTRDNFQVKGLSVEQEKLVTQQHSSDSRVDSPSSSRNSKQNKTTGQNAVKMEEGGGRSGHGTESESMLPPSSPASNASYSSSPYHMHYKSQHFDQRVSVSMSHPLPSGYDVLPRKRHQRSPSDSMRDSHVRASVLRDGSKPERESPLQIGYNQPPSSVSHHYDPLPPSIPPPVMSADGTAAAGSFERSGNVEKSPSPQPWHSNSNCAEGTFESVYIRVHAIVLEVWY